MRRTLLSHAALALALAILGCCGAAQATMYAVAVGRDAGENGGELFQMDNVGGEWTAVSRFRLDGKPVALHGIAIHPKTRVFYGIAAASPSSESSSLVTVEPLTGRLTRVGPLRHEASDLNFSPSGTLYAWLTNESKLGIVDLGTGEVRPLQMSGLGATIGGGFAIRGDGTATLSATSAAGTLDHVDLATGAVSTGPLLFNAPYLGAIVAMDFSPERILYGVNTSAGPPSAAALVRIDVESGRVTRAGPLPDGTSAIAFGFDQDVRRYIVAVPASLVTLGALAILAALVAAGAFGYWMGHRDRDA